MPSLKKETTLAVALIHGDRPGILARLERITSPITKTTNLRKTPAILSVITIPGLSVENQRPTRSPLLQADLISEILVLVLLTLSQLALVRTSQLKMIPGVSHL